MTETIEPRLLKGFRDLPPDEMGPREAMLETAGEVFRRFGFAPFQTPCMEYAEILLGKYGEDAEMLFYRFRDHGDRDVCLRYDLTVPLARYIGQNRGMRFPFKRYQTGPVWRGENTGRGRYREFHQCDVDIVGTSNLLADAECLQVGDALLRELGVEAFTIRVNDRKILTGLGERIGVEPGLALDWVLRTIDKLPTQGEGRVRELLAEGDERARPEGLTRTAVDLVFEFLALSDPEAARDDEEVLEEVRDFMGVSEMGRAGADDLATVLEAARAGGVAPERIGVDLSIARGLDYYTGTVFETFLDELPDLGSVMSGGRYDELIGIFRGEEIPAVGISLGIDRLIAGLEELDRLPAAGRSTPDVLVAVWSDLESEGLGVARGLREAGLATELYLGDKTGLGKQFGYADKEGIPLVAFVAPDEKERGTVALKDMVSGDQVEVPLDDLADEARARLTGRG